MALVGRLCFQGPHSYGMRTFIESNVSLSVHLSVSDSLLIGWEKSGDKSLVF